MFPRSSSLLFSTNEGAKRKGARWSLLNTMISALYVHAWFVTEKNEYTVGIWTKAVYYLFRMPLCTTLVFYHHTERNSIVPPEWRQRDSILWNVTAENKWRPRELERVWLINWFKQGFALQRSTMKFKQRKMRLPAIIIFTNCFSTKGWHKDSYWGRRFFVA